MNRSNLTAIATILLGSLLLASCGEPDKPTVSWFLAVQRGDIDQVERHIHWGSEIDAVFPSGRTALHDAAEKGRIILLKLLIDNNAEIDTQDAAGRSPLDLAVLNGRTQAAEILIEAGASYDPSMQLLMAAKHGVEDRDVVRFLKSHGANLDTTDDQGNTALMIATSLNNHRLVTHLIEQGADVNLRNREGSSALKIARQIGATEISHQLERNGAVLQ